MDKRMTTDYLIDLSRRLLEKRDQEIADLKKRNVHLEHACRIWRSIDELTRKEHTATKKINEKQAEMIDKLDAELGVTIAGFGDVRLHEIRLMTEVAKLEKELEKYHSGLDPNYIIELEKGIEETQEAFDSMLQANVALSGHIDFALKFIPLGNSDEFVFEDGTTVSYGGLCNYTEAQAEYWRECFLKLKRATTCAIAHIETVPKFRDQEAIEDAHDILEGAINFILEAQGRRVREEGGRTVQENSDA